MHAATTYRGTTRSGASTRLVLPVVHPNCRQFRYFPSAERIAKQVGGVDRRVKTQIAAFDRCGFGFRCELAACPVRCAAWLSWLVCARVVVVMYPTIAEPRDALDGDTQHDQQQLG